MSSNTNRQFSQAMTNLEDTDPKTAALIRKKLTALKTEAATWRRQAQAVTSHGETSQAANYEEKVTRQ